MTTTQTADWFTEAEIEEMSETCALALLKCQLLSEALEAVHGEVSIALRYKLPSKVQERLNLIVLSIQHHVNIEQTH